MKDHIELKALIAPCLDIIKEAGVEIYSSLGAVSSDEVEEKEWNSLVSYVDKNAEIFLVSKLSYLLPEAGFITEENTVDPSEREWVWVIDPLDGTTNFLEQIPIFSVSVALMHKGLPAIGIVYEVCRDEMFYAYKGGGAWLNGKTISVSKKENLHEVLTATGFPYTREFDYDTALRVFKGFLTESRDIRRLGSAAVDLSYVAVGRFGVYYEVTLNIWDVAAAVLIVTEAGGIVSDLSGDEHYINNGQILATAPQFYDRALELVSPMKGF